MQGGLILGSSVQLKILDKCKEMLFPYGSQDVLATVTSFGYVFFIFLTAVQMDFSMITRTGYKAWGIALIGLAAPLILCLPTIAFFFPKLLHHMGNQAYEVHVVVLSQTVLSTAVVVSLLNELKIINSELGRLALSSVLVSDIVTTSMATISTAIGSNSGVKDTVIDVIAMMAFGILIPLVSRPAMFWIIKHTPEGRAVKDGYIYLIIVMVLVLGWVAVQIEQDFILGSFVLGLAVPEGPPLGSALVKKLHFFGTCFFLPIFVACSVMKADLSLVFSSNSSFVGFFVVVTHLIKITACTASALFCKMPFKDALALALILNSKGIVEVGLYSGLYDQEVLYIHIYCVCTHTHTHIKLLPNLPLDKTIIINVLEQVL